MNTLIRRSRENAKQYLNRAIRPAQRVWPRASEALIGTFATLVIGLVVLTYSPTLSRQASQWFTGNKYIALMDGLSNPFRNRSLLLHSGLPVYDLKIKPKPFAELETAVEEAKKQGWMSEDQKVEVNAKFFHDQTEYDVSVRIRGDLPPHWEGPKKSWRIKFGRQEIEHNGQVLNEPIYFQGRRQINLVIPKDRDFILAPFVNQLMRDAGLTVARDQFVVLRINGRMQGLYYEVEHFDKPLLAAQKRPETTIFGQNDRAMHFEQYTKYGTPITSDAKYDVGTLRLQVEVDSGLAHRAMEILMEHSRNPTAETFRRARAVLDWDKYLRFRVLTTLFNTNHVRFGSDNFKLYYDPSRGLLEPIPWDVHLVRMPKEPGTIDFWNSHGPDELQRSTILDPQLRLQRNQVLWKLVDDGGERLRQQYKALHDRIRPLAWTDVLTTPIQGDKMDILKRDFEYNVTRVHKVLSHSAANLTYRLQSTNQASIDVAALNFSGIRFNGLQLSIPGVVDGSYRLFEDLNQNGKVDSSEPLVAETMAANGAIRFEFDKQILPTPKYRGEQLEGVYWEFFDTLSGRARFILEGKLAQEKRHPLDWVAPQITASAANAVTGESIPSGLINASDPLPVNSIGIVAFDASHFFDLDAPDWDLRKFLAANPQFSASADRPGAAELRGKVTIPQTVVVPKSVMLILQPGADLTMAPGSSMLCYGGLIASGTAEEPIRVHGDGGADPWGVFAVVRPPEKVLMRHVHYRDGNQAQLNGMLFTGGVAVHNGDLEVESCQFVEMNSEDGLNLKNGKIAMRNCLFSGNAADSCDLDFVTGTVTESRFVKSGNDGLDISGASVVVQDCRFENNGDKGTSVGENSHPTIVNCVYLGNQIGTSCKDKSRAKIAHCTYIDNRLGLEAIRKKPFFGGGAGEFLNCVFAGNDVLISEDYFSRGQLRLMNCLLDVATPHPTCSTATFGFRSPQTGDFRLAMPDGSAASVTLGQAEWLHSFAIPTSVRVPGVHSVLNTVFDSSTSNVSPPIPDPSP